MNRIIKITILSYFLIAIIAMLMEALAPEGALNSVEINRLNFVKYLREKGIAKE